MVLRVADLTLTELCVSSLFSAVRSVWIAMKKNSKKLSVKKLQLICVKILFRSVSFICTLFNTIHFNKLCTVHVTCRSSKRVESMMMCCDVRACVADAKKPGAGKYSQYYRKYGNPNFGGEQHSYALCPKRFAVVNISTFQVKICANCCTCIRGGMLLFMFATFSQQSVKTCCRPFCS